MLFPSSGWKVATEDITETTAVSHPRRPQFHLKMSYKVHLCTQ